MGIQLKNENLFGDSPTPDDTDEIEEKVEVVSKNPLKLGGNQYNASEEPLERADDDVFRGGYGDGTFPAEKLNDLPAYTAPPLMNTGGAGVGGRASKNRTAVYRVVALIFVIAVVAGFYMIAQHFTGSSGKDITNHLKSTEEELVNDRLAVTFTDNPERVKGIPIYTNGKVSVRSGGNLHIVYLNGKQIGMNTDSRKYRFFNVGINDAEQTALKQMTYQYDDTMVVMNDLLGGNSTTYFYYNKKNKDCLVLTMSDTTNRVVNMTYYTNYKKVTETLGSISE